MLFYSWKLIGVGNRQWQNHVFPKSWDAPNHFNSLCEPERNRGALNGEAEEYPYCTICAELAPIREAKAQKKEDGRVALLERKRPATKQKIIDVLDAMSIDQLMELYSTLKRKR